MHQFLVSRHNMRAEESGVTLVELLVAIAITGIVAVGILASLTTLSISSDRARKGSDSGSALVTASDALQIVTYDPACPSTAYQSAIQSAVADTSKFPAIGTAMRVTVSNIAVTTVEYWNPATASFGPTCTPSLAVGDPRRLQLVTLTASLPDARVNRVLQVVKRG